MSAEQAERQRQRDAYEREMRGAKPGDPDYNTRKAFANLTQDYFKIEAARREDMNKFAPTYTSYLSPPSTSLSTISSSNIFNPNPCGWSFK